MLYTTALCRTQLGLQYRCIYVYAVVQKPDPYEIFE